MRVVAITADPSLSVALEMIDDWDFIAVTDAEAAVGAAPDAAVILIGMGSTDDGLVAVETIFGRGVTIPFVVVGDAPAPPNARAAVVQRPFSLDDIRDAVRAVTANGTSPRQASVVPDVETRTTPPEDEAPAEGEAPISLEEVVPPQPDDGPDATIVELHPPRPEPVAPSEPSPAEPKSPPVAEPKQPVRAEPATQQKAPPQPPPPPRPAPPPPPVETPAPPKPTPDVPAARAATPKRRFRRDAQPAPSAALDDPLVRKLRDGARAARALGGLLQELPMLADVGSMVEALLGEIVDQFEPEIASIYTLTGSGYTIAVSHGLSKVERAMKVNFDHPLFAEMRKAPESVLIAPLDLAQGLVAGIGGARTGAFMVAPIAVDDDLAAVIVVGRGDFADGDLDRLDDLAQEASPGLALAIELDRLRG